MHHCNASLKLSITGESESAENNVNSILLKNRLVVPKIVNEFSMCSSDILNKIIEILKTLKGIIYNKKLNSQTEIDMNNIICNKANIKNNRESNIVNKPSHNSEITNQETHIDAKVETPSTSNVTPVSTGNKIKTTNDSKKKTLAMVLKNPLRVKSLIILRNMVINMANKIIKITN
ncbi:hypothetical protein PV327_010093 [Microctonus hyperodae]|uniref:Uncharacterized protein n=1 Tax=Microctonus hyperodae TaxID=165561 RepID=A0AA39F2B6_MICHY|nr:hypothetical protein PV327_010093 [Microctonus hyperodae]